MAAMSREPQIGAAAIVLREPERSIEPTNMGELERLATSAAKTGFFGAKSPEQALLVMLAGRDLGLSYSQALRAFHVIENRPTLSADGMVAACISRGDLCEYFRTLEATDTQATVATKRRGDPERRYTFTIDDAKRAGLIGKANWGKYPSRMLLARARSALARDVYPDLLLGLYDPDEIETVAPSPREELRGEVVSAPSRASTPPPSPETAAPADATVEALARGFVADLEREGREGTKAGAAALAARARVVPAGPWRDAVKGALRRAEAEIARRAKAAKDEKEAAAAHEAQAAAEAADAMGEVEHAQYDE